MTLALVVLKLFFAAMLFYFCCLNKAETRLLFFINDSDIYIIFLQ